MKTHLAPIGPNDRLPHHPTIVDPRTGRPLRALGVTSAGPIWPQVGASQPMGGPPPQQVPPAQVPQQVQPPNAQQLGIPVLGSPLPPVPGQGQQPPAQQPAPVPGAPTGYAPPQPYALQYPPQQPTFATGANQQPAPQQGQQGNQPNQQQIPNGQPGSGNGQQGNANGTWDKPYPQGVPLEQMTVEQQRDFWKYHSRQNEAEKNRRADYDQVVAERDQLRQIAATDQQRAAWEAEQRGLLAGRQQVAASVVEEFFRLAARGRLGEEQVLAQLRVMDRNQFLTSQGTVDTAAVSAYVDTIAPPAQQPWTYGQMPHQPLPGQQVTITAPPGTSPYGQQAMPGAAPQPGYGQQPANPGYGNVLPGLNGTAPNPQQAGYGQAPGYGQVPVPGVPPQYPNGQLAPQQPGMAAAQGYLPQPAGMVGLPVVGARNVPDYGQGPSTTSPANGMAAGAQRAASRHRVTRSQQIAATRGAPTA